MSHEFLRMQKLSGVITEGQYNQKIEELNSQTLNENQLQGVESFLKSKGYKIEDVKGSMEAKEREGEFASGMDVDQDPNSAKKNNKAFISKIPLIQDGVKSFMVFVPRYSPQGKDNEPLRDEMRKKFGGVDPETGAFMISLVIPFESNISETLNENVVGVGATLNPYPAKKKEVYESAFSKFLGEEKDEMREEEEMREEKEEMDEMGMRYEEPNLKEDERTDTEEEGYKDGFKDAIKDAKDAIAKLRKDLKEDDEMEEGLTEDARTDAEEEGYQDGFKDAIKDALDALKGIKGELKEEDDMDEAMSNPDQRHKDDKGSDRGAERKSLDSEPRYNKKDTE